ncbi:E3 ubiquitin-protein ligase Mdm2 [Fistulifera solaris]|uniref:E3 ubiquitin-protein ligase Mdm2 n=1 Tax=Fistulifera solaris TaxID=1519565 RepID=A0A1Z5KKY3_FISSO|nr:E3 ubiquitin-protein ligase Mdm2 [Fistulifera solaris]|eukprot:GAX26974.1 E3 ubiquitin-protein ligase Mdm2 [Fistulifera solaris]
MSFVLSISEIPIPGSFVVFQGMPGDGLVNTIDSLPELVIEEDDEETGNTSQVMNHHMNSSTSVPLNLIGTAMRSQGRLFSTMTIPVSEPKKLSQEESLQGFIVVNEDEHPVTTPVSSTVSNRLSTRQEEAIDRWKDDCWKQQCTQFRDWQETCHANQRAASPQNRLHEEIQSHSSQSSSSSSSSHVPNAWWLSQRGFLAVLEELPQPYHIPKVIDLLAPGMTVVATELITLDSQDLSPVPVFPREEADGIMIYPPARTGVLQVLRIEWNDHPSKQGYVMLSRNGYPFLGPGLPAVYTDPSHWVWRVTCPDGAYVRAGMDLSSTHLGTVPYGSLLMVRRKLVNGMGLSRLQVCAALSKKLGNQILVETIDGWCSEFLNPLSGQRGSILQPLPFPLPALYRIDLRPSATIRSGIELSSPEIGFASYGALVRVTGRAFSEHPAEKCIERLRLAGNGGWISLRLNKHPPNDSLIAVHEGLDPSFDPDQPALFHVEEMRKVRRNQDPALLTNGAFVSSTIPMIASVDDEEISAASLTSSSDSTIDEGNGTNRTAKSKTGCTYTKSIALGPSVRLAKQTESSTPVQRKDEFCVICLTEDRNATMVHGSTGHIACCLMCARILKARRDPCPVCRLPIDLVIQHFYA